MDLDLQENKKIVMNDARKNSNLESTDGAIFTSTVYWFSQYYIKSIGTACRLEEKTNSMPC